MKNFITFNAQHVDSNGNPLSYGRIFSYEAGTSTPKPLYRDAAKTDPETNPIELNAAGMPSQQLFMGDGNYKFIYEAMLLDENGQPTGNYVGLYSLDNIEGDGVLGSVSQYEETAVVANCTDLRGINGDVIPQKYLYAIYYTNGVNEYAQGLFEWRPNSTKADDGGSVFAYAGNTEGRWERLFETKEVTPLQFGAIEDGVTALASAFTNATEFAKLNKFKLVIPGGEYTINGNLNFDDLHVIIEEGAKLKTSLTSSINFTNAILELKSTEQVLQGNWVDSWQESTLIGELTPDFWGADGTGVADSYSAFVKLNDSNIQKANTLYFRRFYTLTGVGAPSYSDLVINRAYFHTGSFLNCQYPAENEQKIIFNEVAGDQAAKLVLGALNLAVYKFNGVFPIRFAFDPASAIPAAGYTGIQKAVSSLYTRPNTILWDSPSSTPTIWQVPVVAMPNGGNFIVNAFSNAYVQIGTAGQVTGFGDIIGDQDCLVTGYGYPILGINKQVKVSWFGVFPNAVSSSQRLANRVSVEHAILTHNVVQNRTGFVDGQGIILNTDSQVSFPTTTTHTFDVRNLNLNNSATAIFNIPNNNSAEFRTCEFTGKVQTSTTGANVTFRDCRMTASLPGFDINIVANALVLDRCIIRTTASGQVVRLQGNLISLTFNEITAANLDVVNNEFSANTIVANNVFKTPMNIYNPSHSSFKDNTWYLGYLETASVYLTASTGGYVVQDFVFEGNEFVYTTNLGPTYEPIVANMDVIARSKNHKATVRNNTSNYTARIRSTEAYIPYYSQANSLVTIPVSYYPIFHVGMSINTSDSSIPAVTLDANVTSGVGSGYYVEYEWLPAPPYADNHIVGNIRVRPTSTGGSVFVYMRGYTIRACSPAGSL